MSNCLAYFRVSTDEQATKGQSIETQQKLCQKWAKDNGYIIVSEYKDEGKSATTLNRPALKELLARCQEDDSIKAVLVQDTDRLARNTLDHLTIKSLLQKAGIILISISQPMIDSSPEGNLIDTIIASVNAFQSQITGRKTSKVMEQKARIGWWPGGTPPLGYRNIENPNPVSTLDKKIIDLDPNTSPYMLRAFELYSTGQYSAQFVADLLYDEGLRSKTGGKFHDSVLIKYLQNPFYIGKMRWRDEVLPGKHPPLVTQEIFDRCQEILEAHNQHASRSRKHNFLLRGFVFCADCGRRLWAEKHVKKSGLMFQHYYCINCRKKSYADVSDLEKQVEKKFCKIQISKEYADQIIEAAKQILQEFRTGKSQDRVILYSRKTKLEAAMREAEDERFVTHTISEESFKRIYPRYEQELIDINTQINKLETNHTQTIDTIKKLYSLAEDIGNAYKTADPALKRFYLDLFWEGFDIKNGKIIKSRLHKAVKPFLTQQLVRVSNDGLPREDSNLQPSS